MAVRISKIFGNGSLPEEIQGELRTILLQMRNERNHLEQLAKRTETSFERAQDLSEPIARIEQSLTQLEGRLASVERLTADLSNLRSEADALAANQRERAADIGEVELLANGIRADLDEIRPELQEMKGLATGALALKADLAELLELGGRLTSMRDDASTLSREQHELREEMAGVREQQGEVNRRGVDAQALLAELESRYRELSAGFAETDERARKLETAADSLTELADGIPNVRRDLGTLKALGDYVSQKISEVEQQREAVEHAASQGERLAELIRRVDRDIQEQQQNVKFLAQSREDIEKLKTQHAELLAQTDAMMAQHEQIASEDASQRQELMNLRDGMNNEIRDALSRFAFERQGVDAASTQIADLRRVLGEVEQRFQSFGDTRDSVTELKADIDQLAERTKTVRSELAGLEAEAGRVRAVHSDVERAERTMEEFTRRLAEVREPAMSSVEEAEGRLADVEAGMQSLEARSKDLDGFTERVRTLALEMEQRERSLEQTLARLDSVAALREDAGTTVEHLKRQLSELTASLAGADQRLAQARELSSELAGRSVDFQQVREHMIRFEERLANWDATESVVAQALDAASERKATVEALRTDIQRLFDVAGQTTENVRAITSAREEIQGSRDMLDGIVAQLRSVQEESDQLERRKRQLDGVEDQVARVEALMIDIRASLDTLHRQKVFLDQVMETAGSLRFQTRHAEALIESLRDEAARTRLPPSSE
jgi:chromosome segregation ATPase